MQKKSLKPLLTVAFATMLLLLSQTVAGVIVILLHSGGLIQPDVSFEELDRLMLEELTARQTEVLLISYGIVVLVLLAVAARKKRRFLEYTGLSRPAGISIS